MMTVVLPVRNGGNFFYDCVNSLIAQDSGPNSFNVIVLDNCTGDGCLKALEPLASRVQMRIIPAERALSIEENWARIRELDGTRDLITVIGHDDTVDPEFVSLMTKAFQQDRDLRLAFAHFRLIDQDGDLIRPCHPMGQSESGGKFIAGRLAGTRDSFGTGYVVRFSDYCDVGGIPPYRNLMWADDALWLQLALRHPMRILEQECFSYRFHTSSTAHLQDSSAILDAFSSYVDLLENLFVSDEGVRRAMTTYGPRFVQSLATHWMKQEATQANERGRAARLDVIGRWRAINSRWLRMVGISNAERDPDDLAASLWMNRHPLLRGFWREPTIRRVMIGLERRKRIRSGTSMTLLVSLRHVRGLGDPHSLDLPSSCGAIWRPFNGRQSRPMLIRSSVGVRPTAS